MVCIPGATMYTIQKHLEIELFFNNYNTVIVMCGCNGVDDSLLQNYPYIKLIRNDLINEKYLQPSGYPNELGRVYCIRLILDFISE